MNDKVHKSRSSYVCGNRRGFHIFIISACTRNVKYILTENVPAKTQLPSRDCTPRALPRASRSGRHVASLLAMTRQGSARCTSALLPLNIPYKAVTDRRYRRNRSVRFYRHLVRTGSAFPRLPRPLCGLAMTRQAGTVVHQRPPAVKCSPTTRSCLPYRISLFILQSSVFIIH